VAVVEDAGAVVGVVVEGVVDRRVTIIKILLACLNFCSNIVNYCVQTLLLLVMQSSQCILLASFQIFASEIGTQLVAISKVPL
jgi:hypothetical protein